MEEPNLTATGTITNSASLYIEGAASEASNDYALWVDAGNVQFDGDLNVTGTITAGTLGINIVDDTSPQLGGNLDVNGNKIVSTSNGDIILAPNGTGEFVIEGTTDQAAAIELAEDADNGTNTVGLRAPASLSSDVTFTLPSADGNNRGVISTDGSGTLSFIDKITLETEQATTSGTTVDFTSIPAGVKRITIMLENVGTDGTEELVLLLGDSGGFETSGYSGRSIRTDLADSDAHSAAFFINTASIAARSYSGVIELFLKNASTNTWSIKGMVNDGTANSWNTTGEKSLSATLTQVRLTTDGTPDDFDEGSINIQYE